MASNAERSSEDVSRDDEKTTGLVRVHENIGDEGVIVELRRKSHDSPWEDDMAHVSEEKTRELRDQLNDYLGDGSK